MAKMSKRRRIWEVIGDTYATPRKQRTAIQQAVTRWGLCLSLELCGASNKDSDDFDRLINGHNCYKYTSRMSAPYFCWAGRNDESRALFAYWMSHLTDKEYNELVEDGRKVKDV